MGLNGKRERVMRSMISEIPGKEEAIGDLGGEHRVNSVTML